MNVNERRRFGYSTRRAANGTFDLLHHYVPVGNAASRIGIDRLICQREGLRECERCDGTGTFVNLYAPIPRSMGKGMSACTACNAKGWIRIAHQPQQSGSSKR